MVGLMWPAQPLSGGGLIMFDWISNGWPWNEIEYARIAFPNALPLCLCMWANRMLMIFKIFHFQMKPIQLQSKTNHKLYQIHRHWAQSIWKIKKRSNWNGNDNEIDWPRPSAANVSWSAFQSWRTKWKTWKVKIRNWPALLKLWKNMYFNWNNKSLNTYTVGAAYRCIMCHMVRETMTVILNKMNILFCFVLFFNFNFLFFILFFIVFHFSWVCCLYVLRIENILMIFLFSFIVFKPTTNQPTNKS